MKQISINILAVLFIFGLNTAKAQTLQEMINTALANNYQIQILKNEAQIATNNNVLGNTGALPSINLNGDYTYALKVANQEFSDGTTRDGTDANNTGLNLSAMVNWTAFNGLRVYAKKDQLGYLEELGEVNSKFYIEQTVSDIVAAYHQMIYEKQLLANYKQSLEISSFRLNLETRRKAIGAGKAMDYGLALVDFQTDSIRFLAQQNTIKTLQTNLNEILNNNLEQELKINDLSFSFTTIPSKENLKNSVVENNQQLKEQHLLEMIAETELRIAKADRSPKIDLFAGFGYARSTAAVGFMNSSQSFGPTAGVSISYNLYNGGAVNRAIKNTKIYKENVEITKEQISQQVDADVLNFYNDYHAILGQIKLASSNVEEMTKVYKTAEQQLQQGAINGYDFRLTQLSLLNSELSLMQLQFSLKTIEINLNRLSGKVLEAYL